MSRTKKTTEPHYELLYLISNKFTEDEVKPIAEKVESVIIANGGVITYQENWGKKKLAYPIKHFVYGYYLYVEFDVEPVNIAKIERSIRMQHDVLRHQIVTRPIRTIDLKEKPKPLFTEEPKKTVIKEPVKKEEVKEILKPVVLSPETTEVKIEESKKIEETEVKSAAKKAKPAKDTKASLEELDAKLDKILETNDLL